LKDRDDSETSASGSQSLLSQLPLLASLPVEEEKSAPIDTSVWFEQSMCYAWSCVSFLAFGDLTLSALLSIWPVNKPVAIICIDSLLK